MSGAVRDIEDILGNVYGPGNDAADRLAAMQINNRLLQRGWVSPEDLAYIVDAAGGEIVVTREALEDSSPKLFIQSSFERDATVFSIREGTSHNKPDTSKAKVNPNAESRNVDSGTIDIEVKSGSYIRGAEEHINPNPGPYS